VGGGDAARAARFAWLLASPGIGREENQQLRDGSLLPARTLRMGTTEAGEGGWVLGVEGSISSGPLRSMLLTGSRHLENPLTCKLPACLPQS